MITELGLQPSEVDRLTTYEFTQYLNLTAKRVEDRVEEQKSLFKALGPLATLLSPKGR